MATTLAIRSHITTAQYSILENHLKKQICIGSAIAVIGCVGLLHGQNKVICCLVIRVGSGYAIHAANEFRKMRKLIGQNRQLEAQLQGLQAEGERLAEQLKKAQNDRDLIMTALPKTL